MQELVTLVKELGVPTAILIFVLWQQYRPKKVETAIPEDCRDVHDAVVKMAEILERQTSLIEKCSDSHVAHRESFARLETKVDALRGNGRAH